MADQKEMTCKKLPISYDLYISGDITENTLAYFQRVVSEKLSDIRDITDDLTQAFGSLNIDIVDIMPNITLPEFDIHLTTYGGDVYAALGIYDIIKNLARDYTVNIICSGYVMSAGIPIILVGTNRCAYENTTFMIHEMSSLSLDKLSKMREDVKEVERLNDIITNIISSNSKITKKQLNEWYDKKSDIFFGTKEALGYELIKEII